MDKLSGGKLAYVYLPNTGQPGYSSFNRYYFAQQDRQGVIVDERYNGGGSAADYMIEVMQRKFDGYFNNVAGDRVPVHQSRGRHLGTEGDDHERNVGLGRRLPALHVPLPPDRHAGGQAHLGRPRAHRGHAGLRRRRLDDRAARRLLRCRDGHWAVENEGVTPDIDVENWPKDVIAGHDPQLEKAVDIGLQQLKEHPCHAHDERAAAPTTGMRKSGLAGNSRGQ